MIKGTIDYFPTETLELNKQFHKKSKQSNHCIKKASTGTHMFQKKKPADNFFMLFLDVRHFKQNEKRNLDHIATHVISNNQ